MKRLVVLAEGKTEATFVRLSLSPFFAARNVVVHPVTLETKRGGQRGGVKSYEIVKSHIARTLKRDTNILVTTMIDLYALPPSFPGHTEASAISDARQRVAWLEDAFGQDIGNRRFLPYLQLHEFEALLFSDVDTICRIVDPDSSNRSALRALARIIKEYKDPEAIDDGNPPSKRLIAQFSSTAYRKAYFGPLIAEEIRIEAIRTKCGHFNDWLTKLEKISE